jgi:hypothetical protein
MAGGVNVKARIKVPGSRFKNDEKNHYKESASD